MSVIRTLFLGTPEFARYHLEHLLKDTHYNVVGVVSQPDRPKGRKLALTPSPVKELALAQSIPVFTPQKASDSDFIEQVKKLNAEVAIVVAYGQILRPAFLELFPSRVVNIHGSILPKLRGAAPIQRTLMNDDREGGVSLQVMVEKLDAGPIIGLRKLQISQDINAKELHDALMPLGADLLHIELMDYLRGNLSPILQDEAKVTLAPKISPAEEKIDWNKTANAIHNQVRGLALQGGAYTQLNGKRFKIHQTQLAPSNKSKLSQGTAEVSPATGNILISCGNNEQIEALIVQPEGKSKMSAADFVKGLQTTNLKFSE